MQARHVSASADGSGYCKDLEAEREQMEAAIIRDYCRDVSRLLVEKVLFLHRDQGFWAAMVAASVMVAAYHKRILYTEMGMQTEPPSTDVQATAPRSGAPGLAYRRLSAEDDRYELIHQASGLGLGNCVETRWEAERWLVLVAPLTNWTQEAPALRPDSALPEKIQQVRRQAEEEASALLKSLLPDFTAQALTERARMQQCSFHDLVIEAVDDLLEGDDDDGEGEEG